MRGVPNKISVGDRFGRLVVLEIIPSHNNPSGPRTNRKCRCLCDCGNETIAIVRSVCSGHTSSCGCLHKELLATRRRIHGASRGKIPEYNSWLEMRRRCLVPTHQAFHNYGGRGIEICERWRESFNAFLEDMGPKPTPQHTIEREDNNGNYEPGNCRWATRKEQANNMRTNVFHEHNGERLTIAQWSDRLGIRSQIISYWLGKNYTIPQIATRFKGDL